MNYYNYFTELEEHFVKRRGKHLLISPMDWALIAAWRDAGVPLQVAIRGIDIAMDAFFAKKRRGSAKINSLCYCHDSVMTEYANHLESQVGQSEEVKSAEPKVSNTDKDTDTDEILNFLSVRMSEIRSLSNKHNLGSAAEGIERVLARLELLLNELKSSGQMDSEILERDLRIIDELMVDSLSEIIPSEQKLAWETEAKKELKVYKKKLPKDTFAKIQENFMRDKIHREFGVGELSLFQL